MDTNPQDTKKRVVLILDPYSSAKLLVHNLILRGKSLVALITFDASTEFSRNNFYDIIDYRSFDDVIKLKVYLKERYFLECVIPGVKQSVLIADEIAAHLKIKLQNKSSLSICRGDRYAMHMRLKSCGLRYISQRKCKKISEAVEFARKLRFRCVCSEPPLASSCEAYKCLNEDDVVAAAKSILASSEVALCQEFLTGVEYIFDSVSYRGIHLPSMVYECEKARDSQGFVNVNTYATIFDNHPNSVTFKLYTYITAVLDALGIINGPSHANVYVTDTGPCLVEIGARMQGFLGPYITEKISSLECSQHFLTADVYVNRGKYLRRIFSNWTRHGILPYEIRKTLIWHDLQVRNTMGILARDVEQTAEPLLSSLPTAQKTYYGMFKNDKLVRTHNMTTSPGGVVLVGCSKQVEKDYKQVLEWERSGMLWEVRKSRRSYSLGYINEPDSSESEFRSTGESRLY